MTQCSSCRVLAGVRVLIVESNSDSRMLSAFLLQEHGAVVVAASSVREALAFLQHHQPDLLISEIGLPEEDGYSLIHKVRIREAERGVAQMPAIAVTVYAERAHQQRALLAGFQKHLAKPVYPDELIEVVLSLVSKKPLLISGEAASANQESCELRMEFTRAIAGAKFEVTVAAMPLSTQLPVPSNGQYCSAFCS